MRNLLPILLCGLIALGCGCAGRDRLVIYAAASLGPALEEAAPLFERQAGVLPAIELASSGALARKLEAGAPAEVFISADELWIDHLERQGRLSPGSRRLIAGNRLVCVARKERQLLFTRPAQLAVLERLAVGDPEHVPAGRYARQALEHYGVWGALEAGDKLVYSQSVRAVLALVEQGEVSAGVVFRSDAAGSSLVSEAFAFPPETHSPIRYYAAVTNRAAKRPLPRAFLEFLSSAEFREILTRHGFTLPAEGA